MLVVHRMFGTAVDGKDKLKGTVDVDGVVVEGQASIGSGVVDRDGRLRVVSQLDGNALE